MIQLHGGFTYGLISGLAVAVLSAILLLIMVHLKASKTSYYKTKYITFDRGTKLFIYLAFILFALICTLIVTYFIAFIISILVDKIVGV